MSIFLEYIPGWIEIVSCMLLLEQMYRRKWKAEGIYLVIAVVYLVRGVIGDHTANEWFQNFSMLIPLAAWIAITFLAYEDTLAMRLKCLIEFYLLSFFMDVCCLVFMQYSPLVLNGTILNIGMKMVQVFLSYLYVRKGKNVFYVPQQYQREVMIGFGIMLAELLFSNIAYAHSGQLFTVHEVFEVIILIVVIDVGVMIWMMFRLIAHSKVEVENQLKIQQMEMQIQQTKDLEDTVNRLRELRHDMNSHLGIIKSLVELNAYEELDEYLNSILKDFEPANEYVAINDRILSILFNSKIQKARRRQIKVETEIFFEKWAIEEKDACALFANLWDNAIEACEELKQTKRSIYVLLRQEPDGYRICFRNPYQTPPVQKNGILITRKEDKKIHGIGSKVIASVVETYGGQMTIHTDVDFCVEIFLPKEKKRGKMSKMIDKNRGHKIT